MFFPLRVFNALSLKNNKILHDYDAYQSSLTDYEYSQYKNNTKAAGFEFKVNDLSQFFNRTGTTNKEAKGTTPEV